MNREDIRIKHVIIHILDPAIGMPVLSDTELEYGSEVAEFLKEHIARIGSGDDAKECRFYREESEVYRLLDAYADEDFVSVSKEIAALLYGIMQGNIDIPSADLVVVRVSGASQDELQGLLYASDDGACGRGGQQQRDDPPQVHPAVGEPAPDGGGARPPG